jgi:hypothetical protein
LKPERWGSPLVQEYWEGQRRSCHQKQHNNNCNNRDDDDDDVVVIIVVIVITLIPFDTA